jgi:hypothetical protein
MLVAACGPFGNEEEGGTHPLRFDFPALVWVSPPVGGPRTTFTVRARAIYRTGNLYDNYHFILRGPGKEGCRGRLASALGITQPGFLHTERRGIVKLSYRPRRTGTIGPDVPREPWCPGVYRGHVEFREPEVRIRLIGPFSFRVR